MQQRFLGALLSLFLVTSFGLGCATTSGKNTNNLLRQLNKNTEGLYGDTCKKYAADHTAEVQDGRYIPPVLKMDRINGVDTTQENNRMPERDFISLLVDGPAQNILVQARSGLGKSKLIEAIQGKGCTRIPVFRFDLKSTIIPALSTKEPGQNAVFNEIARQVGMDETPQQLDALKKGLSTNPWILLLDAMDEVTPSERGYLVDEINRIKKKYKDQVRIVLFSRPPVYSNMFGMGPPQTRAQIRPLSCAQTDERIRNHFKDQGQVLNFGLFADRFQLTRKVTSRDRCVYPHMASYRDVAAVLNIAEAHKLSAAAQLAFDLNWVTRSVLYRQYVEEILRPMASSVAWSTDEALRVVDRIVAGQSPEKGLRNVNFSLEECGQSVGIPNKSKGKELCTALFKLKLFRRMGETFRWTMKNQTVVDYFLARWINRQVARGDKADCSSIKKSRSIFESSEVSSFLIGMRHARQCVPEIITVLCSSGADVEFTIDLIDQGLPTGKIRTKVLERTPSPEGENTKRCVDIVYRNLKESAEAP